MSSTLIRNKAYQQIVDTLPEKRAKVYQAIKELGVCTALNIAFFLHVPINEVTGRVRELKDSYLILEAGTVRNKLTKKFNTLYKIPKEIEVQKALLEDLAKLSDQQDDLLKDLKKDLSITSIKALEVKVVKLRSQINRIKRILNIN